MMSIEKNTASQFASDFFNDLKTGKIKKECMTNHFQEFSEGLEELHRDRFCMYLKSCGCIGAGDVPRYSGLWPVPRF